MQNLNRINKKKNAPSHIGGKMKNQPGLKQLKRQNTFKGVTKSKDNVKTY